MTTMMYYLDTAMLDQADMDACIAWVESLGLKPNEYRSMFAVESTDDGYVLRLVPGRRRAPGEAVADPLNDAQTTKVPIGRELPQWLQAMTERSLSLGLTSYIRGARDALDAVAMHYGKNTNNLTEALNLALGTVQAKADLRPKVDRE